MNNEQRTEASYIDAITAIGNAARDGDSAAKLFAMHGELIKKEADEKSLFPVLRICEVFRLGNAEALALDVAAARLFERKPIPKLPEIFEQLEAFGGLSGELSPVFRAGPDGGCLDPIVRDFLLERAPRLPEGMSLELTGEVGEAFHAKDIVRDIGAFLKNSARSEQFPLGVILTGQAGSGKKYIMKKVAAEQESNLIFIDSAEPEAETVTIAALCYSAMVCVLNSARVGSAYLKELAAHVGVLLMTEEQTSFLPDIGGALLAREVRELTADERFAAMQLWFGADASLEWERASRFYRMTAGQLMKAAGRSEGEKLCGGEASASEQLAILREINSKSFEGNAEMLVTNKTLEDLVLPPTQKGQIEDICEFARARYKVFDEWGFEEKIPYGRGISALFYGASGTGKTLAASVIANELGLRLYRADISQLISKYVGETQKNIGRIFDSAQNSGCILFFDEADALFSRRSDSGDSQDKYSNAEIAYLLQRTEQYDGMILMATNLLQNFDEAFRRRIGYMVYFPLPDAQQRFMLWNGIFPDKAPKRELDFQLLAEHLELSGAGIRNTAINAAYMAAAEDKPIAMAQIADAARIEYSKQGKAFPQKFGMMFPSERSGIL